MAMMVQKPNVGNQRGVPMKKPPTTQEQAAPGAVEGSGRR